MKYQVKYDNGVIQTLTLVSQSVFREMRLAEGPDKEKFAAMETSFKNGLSFTDESPIYMSQYRDGYIVLGHGKFKCELNLVDSE